MDNGWPDGDWKTQCLLPATANSRGIITELVDDNCHNPTDKSVA